MAWFKFLWQKPERLEAPKSLCRSKSSQTIINSGATTRISFSGFEPNWIINCELKLSPRRGKKSSKPSFLSFSYGSHHDYFYRALKSSCATTLKAQTVYFETVSFDLGPSLKALITISIEP